ncbi:pyridoxamine 5'-phosphate oxidase family protein [Roseateles asaccharophilus]|uniref:Pyridoxine 5'-phosphate oxidase superfamily flavin-nucleotide-binding protein n=1 Tax=Roseateles asaccharophilus TaxID=582607 RepID=A0ABU2A6V6_9BURK|nr:pyridoxamine 5'-phosphate oxidase family protein [Roseateles asaccharophilus]MDR7332933.1 putative pyridoxine 5'-phosphate oxidase superfamily flavin-nucleotide-binding protein [Roseateles asaccharophilus]
MNKPFHAGEVAVQARLGVAERMHEIGTRVVRDHMPEQHQRFYEQLPFMLAGSVDDAGRPWATVLVGRPGFVKATDDRHLDFATTPIAGDPAAAGLTAGAPLGLLGIELHTRRRNRVNGQLQAAGPEGLRLRVQQTVGNCPQYIQGREFDWVRDAADTQPRAIEHVAQLDGDAEWLVAAADTLFVASHAGEAGADVSHRGGPAGFVVQQDERTLLVPDYSGNRMFMTLGNLQADGRAGLLFIDFERGDLLTLTGRAEIVWGGPDVAALDRAERAWRFHLDEGFWLRDALPLRWRFRDWAPQNV